MVYFLTVFYSIFVQLPITIHPLVKEKSFEGFSIFSSGSHLVHLSRTVCTMLVEGHPRNIPVK